MPKTGRVYSALLEKERSSVGDESTLRNEFERGLDDVEYMLFRKGEISLETARLFSGLETVLNEKQIPFDTKEKAYLIPEKKSSEVWNEWISRMDKLWISLLPQSGSKNKQIEKE